LQGRSLGSLLVQMALYGLAAAAAIVRGANGLIA
jgi:hypothetical protein